MTKRLIKNLLLTLLLALASCYGGSNENLYSKVGYDSNRIPANSDPRFNKTVPNYYYQYNTPTPAPTYGGGQYQNQYQYQAPRHQQQYAPYPVQQFNHQAAGSRFYSNPYDVPPSPYANQRYDSDQYYVPPSQYYNTHQGDVDDSAGAVHY